MDIKWFVVMSKLRKFAAFDTEFIQKGWNMTSARLCQISCVTEDGVVFNRYVTGGILKGTFLEGKLEQGDINKGVRAKVALEDFAMFIRDQKITDLLGYSPFNDLKLLHYTACRCKVSLPNLKVYDVYDICRMINPCDKTSLLEFYKREFPDDESLVAHNAVDDSMMTLRIYEKRKGDIKNLFYVCLSSNN